MINQKEENRLKEYVNSLRTINLARKHQITNFNGLVKWLIAEGRVTKEEVSRFISDKKETSKRMVLEEERVNCRAHLLLLDNALEKMSETEASKPCESYCIGGSSCQGCPYENFLT
jgi:hypothetical protein